MIGISTKPCFFECVPVINISAICDSSSVCQGDMRTGVWDTRSHNGLKDIETMVLQSGSPTPYADPVLYYLYIEMNSVHAGILSNTKTWQTDFCKYWEYIQQLSISAGNFL